MRIFLLFLILVFGVELIAQPDYGSIRQKNNTVQFKTQKTLLAHAYLLRSPETVFFKDTNQVVLDHLNRIISTEIESHKKQLSAYLMPSNEVVLESIQEEDSLLFQIDYLINEPKLGFEKTFVRLKHSISFDAVVLALNGNDLLDELINFVPLSELQEKEFGVIELMLKMEQDGFFNLFKSWNNKNDKTKELTVECRVINLYSLIDFYCFIDNAKRFSEKQFKQLNDRE